MDTIWELCLRANAYAWTWEVKEHQLIIDDYPYLPLYFIIPYVIFVFLGPAYMKNREPVKIKWTIRMYVDHSCHWLAALHHSYHVLSYSKSTICFPSLIIFHRWNLFLSVLSLWMFLAMFINGVIFIRKHGFYIMMCRSTDFDGVCQHAICVCALLTIVMQVGNGWSYFALWVFAMSKYIELLDTVWLVLKKRPVIFLHWYHHIRFDTDY